jgi:uncharacterized protein (DUF779 family)
VSKNWASFNLKQSSDWQLDVLGRETAPFFEGKRMIKKVIATESALALIQVLQKKYGEIMFHQSGGCCDNSAANCYLPTDLTIGAGDEYLGEIGGVPFYMSKAQYEYWKHTQLIIDVTDGCGGTFSLEGGEGKAFITRSRLFTDAEWAAIQAKTPV